MLLPGGIFIIITRYVNGKMLNSSEMRGVTINTPELRDAIRTARGRIGGGALSGFSGEYDEREISEDSLGAIDSERLLRLTDDDGGGAVEG